MRILRHTNGSTSGDILRRKNNMYTQACIHFFMCVCVWCVCGKGEGEGGEADGSVEEEEEQGEKEEKYEKEGRGGGGRRKHTRKKNMEVVERGDRETK